MLLRSSTAGLKALLLCGAFCVTASVIAQNHCWIKYSYDAAGNRIKREWWCGIPGDPDPEEEVKSLRAADFGFRLAPVPATDMLTLTSERVLENAEVEIVSMQGRVVLKQMANGNRINFNVAGLAVGLYVLRLREPSTEYAHEFNIVR